MGKVGEMYVALGADTKKLKKGMKESQGLIRGTMDAINNMKAELVSIGAVAGPIAAIRQWAGAVNDLEDKTNMAGESASRLLALGEYVGISTEEMAGAMAKMSKATVTAAQSMSTAAASGGESTDVFTRFGIQILDNNGKLLSAEQILTNVTNKHRAMANGVEKTAMEMEIFGRSGAKLNDLLNLTESQMQDVYATAEKTGLVLNHTTTQAFEDAEFQINKSKLAMKGLTASLGAEMLPQLQKLTTFLSDASEGFASLDKNERQNIATALEIAAAVSAISIGWRGLVFLSAPLIGAVNAVTAAYGRLAASAWAAKAAVGGVVLTAAAAAAYKGYEDYQHYQSGGEFEYDDTGNVTRKEGTAYSTGSSDDYDTVSANFNTSTGEYDIPVDTQAGIVDFSGGDFSGGGSKGADQAVKEISEINRQITELQAKVPELTADFEKLNTAIAVQAVDGGQSVILGIAAERDARIQGIDDWLEKVKSATAEAEQIRQRAAESGDAVAMANAEAMLAERVAAERQAAVDAKNAKVEIDRQTVAELQSNATQLAEFKAELDEAMRQGDMERFHAVMSEENVAFMADMAAKQETMQAYYDWRMQAEESFSTFAIRAANQLKTSLGQAAAQALVYGKSFTKAIKDMVKQIAAMYVEWAVQKLVALALSKTIMKQETAMAKAQGAAMYAAYAPAAIAKLIINPGAGVTAALALAAAVSAGLAIGTLGGKGKTSDDGDIGGWTHTINGVTLPDTKLPSGGTHTINGVTLPGLANGGIVTAPTLALIGEAGDEAVIPLSKMGDMFSGGGQVNAVQNIYGDINTGADSDDLFNDFSSLVMSGLRGA